MDLVFILVPLALIFGLVAVVAFIWAVKNGQMDDLETPSYRALFDDVEFDERKARKTEE